MKKGLGTLLISIFILIAVFAVFHRSIISSIHEYGVNQNQERENQKWVNNISLTGTGSCTEREECEEMLGKGAFCSYGKCFPAPLDYDENMAECICSDGTKIKAIDCRWVDCPNDQTISTEFIVEGGVISKAIVDINFPLSAKEAKKVAMAACGISAETSEPLSPYENIISECSPAWGFLDETNPCNNTQAQICANKTFASCIFGGETIGATCIEGQPLVQGEYNETFIVANPVDLSQVKEFTKFRSCSGHDYSGYNINGELETQRSMKQGAIALSGIAKLNVYAPFDGVVAKYYVSPLAEDLEEEEHAIEIIGYHSGKWFITFSHFTANEGLKVNSKVKAGELIGTSTIHTSFPRDGVEIGLSQDISTETKKEQFVRGSILDYVADNVLAEYASYGLTPENVAFTKEYRDSHPCDWSVDDNSDRITLS